MNANDVKKLYLKLMAHDAGMRCVKFDLHVHTPASKCFSLKNGQSQKDAYIEILNTALKHDIEIIAISDHNTFRGYNEVKALLENDPALKQKYSGILVLCGIEITCFSKHLLVVFDVEFSDDQQNKFLDEIGIPREDRGTESALADIYGPSVLMEKIAQYGGISILAHADSQDGFLYSLCREKGDAQDELRVSGKSLAKIIASDHLYGIQISNENYMTRLRDALGNKDYIRHGRKLAYLSFSDYHGKSAEGTIVAANGKCLGQIYSTAKLSHKSYQALRMALSDPEIRIVSADESYAPVFIIGCAIQSPVIKEKNEKFCFIRFNPEMNCIIGARGTGKSTILEIIQHIISLDKNYRIEDRFNAAVIYFSVKGKVFAYRYEPRVRSSPDVQVYVKNGKDNFTPSNSKLSTDLKKVITIGYRQRQLYEYSKDPSMILEIVDAFIKWKYGDELEKAQSQVIALYEKLKDQLYGYDKAARNSGRHFLDYIDGKNIDSENLVPRISKLHRTLAKSRLRLHNLRGKMIDELNHVLDGRVNLTLCRTTSPEVWDYYLKSFSYDVMKKAGRYYDYKAEISRCLEKKIFPLGQGYQDDFDFFRLLLEKDYTQIIDQYKLKLSATSLGNIRACITPDDILFSFDSSIQLKYNINSGRYSKEIFRSGEQLSLGQHAVALLLLILEASFELSDNRPLLMDQPEDDLDNSYIYNALVGEFRNSKTKRQIIISTHNANIPVASDAENIIVLGFDGSSGYIANNGSLDRPCIADSVIDTLEGGKEAIQKRQAKYCDCI